jgi:hypothetical protein
MEKSQMACRFIFSPSPATVNLSGMAVWQNGINNSINPEKRIHVDNSGRSLLITMHILQ